MDIFNLKPKFEVPVIEERPHINKGSPSWYKGRTHTEEARRKMSEAHKGKKHSAEACAKISAAKKGKTPSAEHRAKLSAALKGRKGKAPTGEVRRKISETKRATLRHLFYGKHPAEWAEIFDCHKETVKYWKKQGKLLQKLQERGYCLEETA